MRPGFSGVLQSKKAIFAPSLGAELAGGVPFASGSEEGGRILWQPSTFSHELLCEVYVPVEASDQTIYRITYIKLTKKTFGGRPLTSAQINLESCIPYVKEPLHVSIRRHFLSLNSEPHIIVLMSFVLRLSIRWFPRTRTCFILFVSAGEHPVVLVTAPTAPAIRFLDQLKP
jgi:hypothetical protein